jgi:hypothetical protein
LADGGTIRLVESAGPFVVTVFTAPEPLRVGPVDVSVLVQDRLGGTPLLDVQVTLQAAPPAGDGATALRDEATRAEAGNKLVYASVFAIDRPGAWTLRATVRRGDETADVSCALPILPATSGLRILWPFLALPPAAVLLYALHGWLARRRGLPASLHVPGGHDRR